MKKIILASNNSNKLREFRQLLEPFGYEVLSQREAGVNIEAEETGSTFAENAYIKAKTAVDLTGLPAIADDSGLQVDALNGEPGIYSARYGPGHSATDAERYTYLLKKLENETQRSARFVCSICCLFPNGDKICSEETCEGDILYSPRGSNGFGYDPVFKPAAVDVGMAELTPEEKNSISHRGKAVRDFITKLTRYTDDNK